MTENQKKQKSKSQMYDSETFLYVVGVVSILFILMIIVNSCKSTAQEVQEEKILIHMNNGDILELVADEYGNQYLRQNAGTVHIYIPYMGVTEEQSDSLKFYNVKNK